jgi:TonB family protein
VVRRSAADGKPRSEPLFLQDPDAAPARRLSPTSRSSADDGAGGRREPAPPRAAPAPAGAAPPAEREAPVESWQRTRPFGPVGALVLHLLPLLLLLDWPLSPPAAVTPIPVRLVFQPPPPAKPSPAKPQPKPEVRPPPGRLASEDIGDTKTQGHDRAKSEAAAASEKPATAAAPPPEPEQKTATVIPPPVPGTSGLPNDKLAPEPPRPKPKPSIREPLLHRAEARIHLAPRPARIPGPAATRDEYLAYLAYLTRRHLNLLPMSVVGGRRGQTVIDILVLDNGTVARLEVGRSSGYPDIDRRIEAMIHAVGRFPPLPQWFQGPSMQLEFSLRFPEALED